MSEAGYNLDNISDFHKISLPYLGEKFFPNKKSKILDIGAGSGHSLFPLKNNGWGELWAVDIDDFNKGTFEKAEIIFNQVDVEKQPLPYQNNFFDVIISFHVIEHLLNPHNYLEEIERTLKNSGVFIMVTPNWRKQYRTFWRDPTHVHPYDKESIRRILKSYNFNPIAIKDFGVIKGAGRTKLWKLFKNLMFTGIDLISISKKQ